MSKKKYQDSTIKSTMFMFKQVWKESKSFVVVKFIYTIIMSLFAFPQIIIPGLIINELLSMKITTMLILYVCFIVFVPALNTLINRLFTSYLIKKGNKLTIIFEEKFYRHMVEMDYETLENPDIQVLKERAQETTENILGIVDKICAFVSAFVQLIGISYIVSNINPIIVILIVVITYLNYKTAKKINGIFYQIDKDYSKFNRYQYGLSSVLENIFYAKELRLFNLKSYFIDLYKLKRTEANKISQKKILYQHISSAIGAFLALFQQIVLYVYVIYEVLYYSLPIGNMTIYLSAASQFSGVLQNVFNSYISLSEQRLYVQELIDFLSIPTKMRTGTIEPVFNHDSVIEFVNVSFKYPGSEHYALKNCSITLHGNEKLCIVGANGSGKSTFAKLLTRLYTPEKGRILLNGIDINMYDYEKYQRLFAPVFQDYCMYHLTVEENIVLSQEKDKEKLKEVCTKCKLNDMLNTLPKGIETPVYKWEAEDGFEPSGGEEQRIAIARASYHNGEIFILDEPTASLDPIAEHEIYTQFNNMIVDKCAVLITHRLSAVQLADKIAVFEKGKVVEYGTHHELYTKGGIYTVMFDKQAQFYVNNAVEFN